jgi:hypothetical protein
MPSFSISHRLNAQEAKMLADDAHASTLEHVYNQIYEACLKGRDIVTVFANLTNEIVHALKEDGYQVHFDGDERGARDFWVVSWKSPKKE